MGLIPSLSTVLIQEITKFNDLLKTMKTSLVHLRMAIGGQMVMSSVKNPFFFLILSYFGLFFLILLNFIGFGCSFH